MQHYQEIDEIYYNGGWTEEDKYEVMKVQQVIRNHIFKG